MRKFTKTGFALLEVVVAIAVMAILAGAAAPLVLKSLNQQREQKTRESLQIAFEAMFGRRDKRVANMMADFGFDPRASATTLGKLTRANLGPGTIAQTPYALNGASFNWGWNGPYWTGSVETATNGIPADAWGRPIQLRWVGGGYQLISAGANGTIDTGAAQTTPAKDDLLYPASPVLPTALLSSLYVTVTNQRLAASNVSISVHYRLVNSINTISTPTTSVASGGNLPLGPGTSPTSLPALASGPVSVSITVGSATYTPPSGASISYPAIPATSQVIDLLPGESRTLNLTIN